MAAGLAGGASAYFGFDMLLTQFGIPQPVHWALAGIAVDMGCQGPEATLSPLMEAGMSAGAGYAGAMVAKWIAGK